MARAAKKGATKRAVKAAGERKDAPPPRIAPGSVFRPAPRAAVETPEPPRPRRVKEREATDARDVFRPRRSYHSERCTFAARVYLDDVLRWENRWFCDDVCGAPLDIPAPGSPERLEGVRINVATGERWAILGEIEIRLSDWLKGRALAGRDGAP